MATNDETPIFLLVLAKGMTEAWYQLSKAEQEQLWAKVEAIDAQAGVTWLLSCSSRWCDEECFRWTVGKYPSMAAYRAKVLALEQLDWWRYFTGKTILGTELDMARALDHV